MDTSLKNIYLGLVDMLSALTEFTTNQKPVSSNRDESKPVLSVVFRRFVTNSQNALKSQRMAEFIVELTFKVGRESPYIEGLEYIELLDDGIIKHWTSLNPNYAALAIQNIVVKTLDLDAREDGIEVSSARMLLEVTYIKTKNYRRLTT